MPSSSTPTFGDVLRGHRLAAGLTQEALAERAGLSVFGIQKLERGTTHPYRDTTQRLVLALQLAPEDQAAFTAAAQPTPTQRLATPQATASPDRHNLPVSRTSLIGRQGELAEITERLQTARLVTLTGVGGCGKTRLALAVAADLVDTFTDGVWLVDLAPVRAPELVPYAVAPVLGRRERPGEEVLDAVVAHLSTRELLLVLDNCEHLLDGCAGLAERILDGCPRVKLLATSRERLRIPGEVTWRVPSLAAPEAETTLAPGDLLAYPAVQLFVERAQAVQPAFALGPANASAVAAVCTRLEGLPLALELAAARVSALSVPQLLERLDDSFRLLVGGSRTAPSRQQTLRAALDWSHGLLSGYEQVVFRRLAVFAGGWTLEAAETVCTDADIARTEVLELLTQLVEKSLVMVGEQDGRSRYRLLEPVRQYAMERLAASGELDMVRRKHASFFLGFAEAHEHDASVGGAQRASAVQALEGEYRNLQVALQCALDTGDADLGLRLARTLQFVWNMRLPVGEGQLWLDQLLRLPGAETPTPARAVALFMASWLAWLGRGDYTAASAYQDELLPLARQIGDPWILHVALADRGLAAEAQGDHVAARAWYEQGLVVTRNSGDRASEACLWNNLGRVSIEEGDYAAGRAQCETGLRLAHQLGDTWVMSGNLGDLALGALAQGELATARALVMECLSLVSDRHLIERALCTLAHVEIAEGRYAEARRRGLELLRLTVDRRLVGIGSARTLETLAAVAAHMAQPDVALRLAGAAEAEWEAVGARHLTVYCDLRDRWLVPLRKSVRQEDAQCWWAEGRALSLRDALALAQAALLQNPRQRHQQRAVPGQ